MKITVTVTDRAIDLCNAPKSPSITQVDDIMSQISNALGVQYGAVKLSGYWCIGTLEPTWSPISNTYALRKSFARALADAFNCAVVTQVPMR